MGRLRLILRLAGRDLRRRPFETVMVLVVIAAAATTLTVGLALRGVTDNPYRQTRAATAGPDAVAGFLSEDGGPADPAALDALLHTPGITGHSGPYPLINTSLRVAGRDLVVQAEGRDTTPAIVDQPKVLQGQWVHDGGVVVERGFADALGVRVGEPITVGGTSLRVAGIAVTAGLPAYPSSLCHLLCFAPVEPGPGSFDVGLIWLTTTDTAAVAKTSPLVVHLVNLRLADPASASTFAAAHDTRPGPGVTAPFLLSWPDIQDADTALVRVEQTALQLGAWLLALLAVAGLAVLAGRRMVDQTRRVGLLKAVGGTPALIAAVLLIEHLVLALAAAMVGLAGGRLLAPRFAGAGAGLIGAPDAPGLTAATVALVTGAALAVAAASTLTPALRAARTSTMSALTDPARPPRRSPRLVAVSARLPVPFLLGLRLVARRPARALLYALSTAVTVTGLVTILAGATVTDRYAAGIHNLRAERLTQVSTTLTVMLVVLAVVNTVFMTWATVSDARHTSALARTFGASPGQVSAGFAAAQLLPAIPGALIGLPAGLAVYRALTQEPLAVPPGWQLLAVLAATIAAVTVLAGVPAHLGTRRPIAAILTAETT